MTTQGKIKDNRKLTFKFCIDCFDRKGCKQLKEFKHQTREHNYKVYGISTKLSCVYIDNPKYAKDCKKWHDALEMGASTSTLASAELFSTEEQKERRRIWLNKI